MSSPSPRIPEFSIKIDQQTAVLLAAGGVAIGSAALLLYRNNMEPGTRMPRFLQRLADSLYTRAGGQSSDARNATSHMSFPTVAPPVLYERGGNGQTCEERLYVQLHVLDANSSANLPGAREKLKKQLETRDVSSVVYDDVNNPRSIGLLTWSTDPSHFVKVVNPILQMGGIGDVLTPRPRWTMFGKTYANGHEPSLVDFLIEKVPRNATRADAPYAVWYPMRRSGDFYMQSPEDQCRMLLHHAAIGKAFAEVLGGGGERVLDAG